MSVYILWPDADNLIKQPIKYFAINRKGLETKTDVYEVTEDPSNKNCYLCLVNYLNCGPLSLDIINVTLF